MMKKIKYLYNINSEYDGDLGFEPDVIEAKVSKIINLLLNMDEIFDNSCLNGFKFKSISFDILFTDDSKIQEVNRDYRNKDVSTDVITFALFADDDFKMVMEDDIYLGEILISVDTAKKQAKDGVKNEVSTLITHGILHLLGFDHQTEEDYNFIVNIQDRVLNLL